VSSSEQDFLADEPHFPDAELEARRHFIFAPLGERDIARLERFGERRRFHDGERLFELGKPSAGMYVVLSGSVAAFRRDPLAGKVLLGKRGPGFVLAELGHLWGHRAPFEGVAEGEVEALLVPPDGLRRLMVTEVELGTRLLELLVLRRKALAALGLAGPILVAPRIHPRLHRLQEYLLRTGYPHSVRDPDSEPDAATLIERHGCRPEDLPLVVCPDGSVLKNPGDIALGRYLDVLPNSVRQRGYDVAVVGAGPAGLSAAVYAASEGLSVLVIDARGFGGQAGASARIENYFGFPMGLTGQELTGLGFTQAVKFGTEFAIPAQAVRLTCPSADAAPAPLGLELDDGRRVSARAVVLASGARYRRPDLPGIETFEGRGVSYWASPIEAHHCRGQDVVLVGGGNSAGQAAVFLSEHAARVLVLVRGKGLSESMSRYLVDRIAATPNIHVEARTELSGLQADEDGELACACWRHRDTGVEHRQPVGHVFLFVGADPATEWLRECQVALDAKGSSRPGPTSLETTWPGADGAPSLLRWRRTSRESSPWATSGAARSSASGEPSARARQWSPSSTPTWPTSPARRLLRPLLPDPFELAPGRLAAARQRPPRSGGARRSLLVRRRFGPGAGDYRYRAPISCTSSLIPGVIVALMVALLR
jgi:thioredoxin reductase (NADPH)